MDIGQLIQSDTADCVIVDPRNGNQTDIVITVYGKGSAEHRAAIADIGRKKAKDSDASEEDMVVEFLASVTKSWVSVEYNEKNLPFNRKNALLVYSKSSTIRDQISAFVFNASNFMPPRSTD
jgi:hypothetical protein